MAHLLIESGNDKGEKIPLPADGEVSCGRDTACTHQILDIAASRRHFRIVGNGGGAFRLEDLESRNGTHLNGARVDRSPLTGGDRIRVGETIFLFVSEPAGADTSSDPLAGKTVSGYHILERIGVGGMGTVYKALQVSLCREVALKILSKRYTEDEKFVEMFVREARAAGGLNHPNIVQVYDVGKEDGHHFFSMEYMARGSVGDLLKELGTLSVPRALAMILHAAKGLEYAEKRGLIHCDIKPDNLMLNEEGTVKIVDLGLSRTTMGEKEQGEEDVAFGTPHFVSPEQAQRKKLDHRADIYSLGASFFLMVTGQPVFSGASAKEIVMKHIKEPPPKAREVNPAIPESVSNIIDRMLKKEPGDRYPTAASLLEDLRKANIEVNPQAAYTDGFPGLPDGGKSRPTGLIALGGAAVVILLAAVFVLPSLFGSDDEADAGASAFVPGVPSIPGAGGESEEDAEEREKMAAKMREIERRKKELERQQREARELEAQKDLKAVREFHTKQGLRGETLPEVIEKYEAVARKHKGTPAATTAMEIARRLRQKREALAEMEAEASALVKEIEAEVRRHLATQRYALALEAYRRFPAERYEETRAADDVKTGLRVVEERAKDAWVMGTTESRSLERRGNLVQAQVFYRNVVDRWGLETYVAPARREIERLQRKLASQEEAAAAARKAAELSRLREAERRATGLAESYDFRGAREAIQALLSGSDGVVPLSIEEVRQRGASLLRDYGHLISLKERIIGRAKQRAGRVKLEHNGRTVAVLGADEEYIHINMGGAQTRLKWASFETEALFEAAMELLAPGTPEDHLRLGVFAMMMGLPDKVDAELDEASRGGPPDVAKEAQGYRRRFHGGGGRAGKQLEAEAEARYREIGDLFLAAEQEEDHGKAIRLLNEALEMFEQWMQDFSQTQFVKKRTGG